MSDVFLHGLAALRASRIVDGMGWLLVHSVWQFTAIAFVMLVIGRFQRQASASTRYVSQLVAMLLMVCVPFATWVYLGSQVTGPTPNPSQALLTEPEMPLEQRRPASGPEMVSAEESFPAVRHVTGNVIPEAAAGDVVSGREQPRWAVAVMEAIRPWLTSIVGVWCLGVLLCSMRPLWGWYVVRRLTTCGVSPVAEAVQQAFARTCEQLKITRRVGLLQSTLVKSPVVVGCFRSVILVPASFLAGLPVSQLEAILAHELAHVRRYDYLINLLQTLVETLFFYHPAVWWLSHRIRMERENCCDDFVVAVMENKVDYSRALLAMEELRSAAVTSLALGAKGGSLLARVKRLFADASHDTPRSATGVWMACLLLVVAAAATMWTSAAAQSGKKTDVEMSVKIHPSNQSEMSGVFEVINGKVESDAAGVKVMAATRAGRWQITEGCELEITQKLVHATDVMTSGVLRLQDSDGNSRHVPLSIAVDYFANRVRWKAVWEEGKPVLWYAKGLGDGPGRKLPPDAKIRIEELQRIDFSNPNCIEHRSYTGWAADPLPSVELRAALEETFEIKADGQEHHRYYESAVVGASDKSVAHLFVWIGDGGKIEVEDLAWVPNETSREVKCTSATLNETLALVMKKYRDKQGVGVPVYAFVTSRPQLALADLNSVLAACRHNGLITPNLDIKADVSRPAADFNRERWKNAWRQFYAAQPASDLPFIRNATVDLTGMGVTDEAAKQFVNDFSQDKRPRLIDGILANDAFVKFHAELRSENDAFQTRLQTLPPRILRGPAAQFRADVYRPKAGKPVDGLALAIALRSATNRFKVGERIPLDVLLFNASDEAKTHDFSFDFIGNPPRVVDETGNEVPIEKLFLSGSIALHRETLRPGDYFLYPHIGLGLGENPMPGENWHPHTPPVKPGKYRLTQQWKDLTSGEIEFEVVAAGDAHRDQADVDKTKRAWKARRVDAVDTQSKETFEILGDDSIQMSLPSPNWSAPLLKFKINDAITVDSIRLELLPDTRFKDRRLGRMPGRTLKLFEVKPSVISADGSIRSITWDKCSSLQNPEDAEVSSMIDYATDTGWIVPPLAKDQAAQELLFRLDMPLKLNPGDTLAIELDSGGSGELDSIARFRVSFPVQGKPAKADKDQTSNQSSLQRANHD